MGPKISLSLSVVAVVISLMSFAYRALTTEIGVLIGSHDHKIYIKKYLDIYNSETSLSIRPTLIVRNNGTLPLRITKVRALVQLGPKTHIFKSSFIANISPQSVSSGRIELDEELTNGEMKRRNELSMEIENFFVEKYKKKKNREDPIFLSQNLKSRVKTILEHNTGWLKDDDHYYLLLLIWLNDDDQHPSEMRLFKFKFTSFQKKVVTDYQINAADIPRSDLVPDNTSVSFYATSRMKPIEDPEKRKREYGEYERLATE